jgi:hypothetical protein
VAAFSLQRWITEKSFATDFTDFTDGDRRGQAGCAWLKVVSGRLRHQEGRCKNMVLEARISDATDKNKGVGTTRLQSVQPGKSAAAFSSGEVSHAEKMHRRGI